jgi:hypothetical protein
MLKKEQYRLLSAVIHWRRITHSRIANISFQYHLLDSDTVYFTLLLLIMFQYFNNIQILLPQSNTNYHIQGSFFKSESYFFFDSYLSIYMYIYMYIYTYMHILIYVYVLVHEKNTYIYTYIYIYISQWSFNIFI